MPDAITRLNAALEGRYRIERELGEGGMATVYLAEDIKHERRVALKVLKPELAAVVGAERFLAEIKTTANLKHPHILPLFDSGEADSHVFYVMPHVEGESLRERIDREKQLPVDEAVRIATAVANALQHAHERGVIHRDIKPANILIQDGEPLIADFGIALAIGAGGGTRLTETGLSVGTPYYMSPEQATGDQEVGPASDTYALAAVLYEILTGDPPYVGSTAQAVLGKIIQGALVSATEIRKSVPTNVDAAIRKALEKLPADRFAGAQDFARALADPAFSHGDSALTHSAQARPRGAWNRLSVGTAALAVVFAFTAAWGWLRPTADPGVPTRAQIDIGGHILWFDTDIIISQDGSRLAFSGLHSGPRGATNALYWREAAGESFRFIPGTEGAHQPAFSPEGDWIVYSTGAGALMKVSPLGGAPVEIVPESVFFEGARGKYWGDDGTVVFAAPGGLYRVDAAGGTPALLMDGPANSPQLLPGGRAVVFSDGAGIKVLNLESDSIWLLIQNGVDPLYIEDGPLLYADASGGLWAVPFDASRLETRGDPVLVSVDVNVNGSRARYRVSGNGTLVYGAAGAGGGREQQLLVVDTARDVRVASLEPRRIWAPRWSPDGERVAYDGTEPGDVDAARQIYTYDIEGATAPRQLTFEGQSRGAVWSPDGTRLAFASQREGSAGYDLYIKSTDDSPPELVVSLPGSQAPNDWPSQDSLIFESGEALWIADLSSDPLVVRPYVETDEITHFLRVSPNGSWAAYRSGQARGWGFAEVHVRSFPDARQPEIVSPDGGGHPTWSPDGRTLYYWTPSRGSGFKHLIAARIDPGSTFTVLSRDTVLSGPYIAASDLHPDGDRWVVARDVGAGDAETEELDGERIFIVTNWFVELRELMGGN